IDWLAQLRIQRKSKSQILLFNVTRTDIVEDRSVLLLGRNPLNKILGPCKLGDTKLKIGMP
ncbi:MAG: hypothetical protein ACHQ1H_02370, partial [Nitrososphaerales archaeon]